MKGFIEVYALDTERYYINVTQIKYFYVPVFQENGERNITIVLGDGRQIQSRMSITDFQDLINRSFED
ncbi:hypothetical protein H3Z85_15195 [Chryseobacterium indologenes]|uniref:hypothetical protein n=1 Tax=Chryseobacterium indologenes TaxID=253 RepID=UPI0003E06D0F|nr:hypothetical protein [Chryseobacterium indologenes]QPQ50751.1 hypothetical protein H3Z85_15195 [Chryseobacterium indologenes]GAE62858.1 hypothetical protein CIN01S_01_00790 [Chryseobacterium indologenes NBRC 14944]SFJ21039.1 hypothetical protein SAMN05421692_1382 [Chryseobacterium indologenes]SUX53467.1 Uncharacterised protein [Chryseobacterium indologenes]